MTTQPLAARMRPTDLSEIVGQDHLIFPGSPLEFLTAGKGSSSVLLYGPPGTGKTSIASVIATSSSQRFIELSATSAGVKDVRTALTDARKALNDNGTRTLIFVDEIHRFSKSQQDVLLPAVENGTISLIGATTENPSFSVNSALVSRSILMVLQPIIDKDIVALLRRAIDEPKGLDHAVTADDDVLTTIAQLSSGDVRQALNRLETCADTTLAADHTEITIETVEQVTGVALQRFDRDGDQHYDVISAFIKSMRGSDPDAALYWLARMIEAGEDPRFIARRVIISASEDVGMADPNALGVAVAAADAVQLIGMPEGRIPLAEAVVYLATAAKSNASYRGVDEAIADVRAGKFGRVPRHLRDSHYAGAKRLGHGKGYVYPHDSELGVSPQQYLPDELRDRRYYRPTEHGHERDISARLQKLLRIIRGR